MKDISLHLTDIIQNSVTAKAGRIKVIIDADQAKDCLKIIVSDDGSGMDKELLAQVTNPFVTTRTTRKVGLGISLFKASAEEAGGKLEIRSEKGKGTELEVSFRISSIDRIPLGDIPETVISTILSNPDIQVELILNSNKESFSFNSSEVKEKLGEVPITEYNVLAWIKEFVNEGIKITFGGVLDEIYS
ncbi:MAG: ATP-binding protein [Clostridia bacterium]|nr:ATP-binding protein [Clostridia bacterium]